MKTKVEKWETMFTGDDFYKLTITRPNIGAGKDYVYYFKGTELDELIKQIKEVKKCIGNLKN